MSKYLTPLGEKLTEDEVQEQERIVCDSCEIAVIEDEFIPCDDCDASWCLYCWEAWGWICKKCGSSYYSVNRED